MRDWQAKYAVPITNAATKYGLDILLVEAIVLVESGGNPWAMRFEPKWKWWVRWDTGAPYKGYLFLIPAPPGVSRRTEQAGQATSFGLMQIMGGVAREIGFRGQFLTELCDPIVGLDYGCKFLKRVLDMKGGDVEKALVRWNGSSQYPAKVYAAMQELKPVPPAVNV